MMTNEVLIFSVSQNGSSRSRAVPRMSCRHVIILKEG